VRPMIVTLCGSTRFRDEFELSNEKLTLEGCIVLAPGVFVHSGEISVTDEEKRDLDELHLRKIDLADRVVVVAPGGYIGQSTAREIAYAEATKKPVEIWTQEEG
jgi:hypothetical protein